MSTQQGIEKEITVLTNKTINVLLKENADALALYIFYMQGARRQKTNQVWHTDKFCRKGLGFGKTRLENAKKVLYKYNLIEKASQRQKGKFTKHYIKINYLWKKASLKEVNHTPEKPRVDLTTSGQTETNALSKDTRNALSKNNKESKNFNDMEKELIQFLEQYNRVHNTKFKAIEPLLANYQYWRKTYSQEEILEAVRRSRLHDYWRNRITPVIMLRTNADKIGEFLNLKSTLPDYKDIQGDEYFDGRLYKIYRGEKVYADN